MTVPRDDVRLLSGGDEVIAERFLLTRPETTMILRSNLARAGLAKEGRTYEGTYAGAIDGDALDGLAALYWNDNLVLAGGQHVWPSPRRSLRVRRVASEGSSGRRSRSPRRDAWPTVARRSDPQTEPRES
jgi:hypothetical protein